MLKEVPEGFIVVKRGGRPPKHARDIAVLLAVHWRCERLNEKVHQAHEWAMDTWGALSDPAGVRKVIRKARKVLKDRGLMHMTERSIYFTRTDSPHWVPVGADVWFWDLGDLEATLLRVAQARLTMQWQQTYNAWGSDRYVYRDPGS